MKLREAREEIIAYAIRMTGDDLTVSTSGNVSVRVDDRIVMTPSGVEYDRLTPEIMCILELDGTIVEAPLRPSTEVPMHTAVYAATDAQAVVHTHPMYATTISTLTDELPPVHYMVALLGGPVRVAPYATFGTQELADHSVRAMEGRTGVLLANHGMTTYGGTLQEAYTRSLYLEWVSQLYYRARLLGEPDILPLDEIWRVRDMLAHGHQQDPDTALEGE